MNKKRKKEKEEKSIIHRITHPNILPATFGQRAADGVTRVAGSWGFIMTFVVFLILWMIANVVWMAHRSWDPYPFILLNLVLSCLAALQAPIILMSQNRQSQKDRQRAEYDYAVNRKAAKEIDDVKKAIERIERHIRRR